jgi:hypothetical protein
LAGIHVRLRKHHYSGDNITFNWLFAMQNLCRKIREAGSARITPCHTQPGSPRRAEAETFVRRVFARRYQAAVSSFAPNLTLLEQRQQIIAAAGWRGAENGRLFLERYLDTPVEQAMARLADESVERRRIVEVGNLASERAGGSVQIILALAGHLAAEGYEWVVFTATAELIRIFAKLGLPLLALAPADPARLGEEAKAWGNYYETAPVVVAGRIRWAFDRQELWA